MVRWNSPLGVWSLVISIKLDKSSWSSWSWSWSRSWSWSYQILFTSLYYIFSSATKFKLFHEPLAQRKFAKSQTIKVLWEWIFNSSLWQLPIYDYQLKCRYCESENKPITDLVNAKVRNIKKVHRWNSFWPSFPLFNNCNKARHNWMGFTGVWWQQPGISEHALPIQFQHYYILTREANENKITNKTSQTLNNINKNFCLVSALPLTSWLPKKNLKACLQRFYSLQKFSGVFTL